MRQCRRSFFLFLLVAFLKVVVTMTAREDRVALDSLELAMTHILSQFDQGDIRYVSLTLLDVGVKPVLRKFGAKSFMNHFIAFDPKDGRPADVNFVIAECQPGVEHVLNASSNALFAKSRRVVLISDKSCDQGVDEVLLDKFELPSASVRPARFWAVYPDSNNSSHFQVFGVAYYNQESENRIIDFGSLPLSVPNLGEADLHSNRGVIMRAVTVTGPFQLDWDSALFNDTNENRLKLKRGLSSEVWEYIWEFTGLSETFQDPTDTWGSKKDMLGMTGRVARGEADIAGTLMAQCCEREQVIDYTTPIELRRYYILFEQPNLAYDILFIQFSGQIWTLILLTVITLQLSMAAITYYNIKTRKIRNGRGEYKYMDMLSWSLCLVAQQGYEKEPKRNSQRIIFFVGYVFGMLCFCGFSASIIPMLVKSRSLSSFEELVNYEPININVAFLAYFQSYMRGSPSKLVDQMMRRYDDYSTSVLHGSNAFDGKCQGPSLACDQAIGNSIGFGQSPDQSIAGPDDYIFDSNLFHFMGNRYASCLPTYFALPTMVQDMVYGLRKGLPYKSDINLAIIRLKETGLLRKMYNDYYPHKPNCEELQQNNFREVSIMFVYSAYYVLLGGYALAILICLTEMFISATNFAGLIKSS